MTKRERRKWDNPIPMECDHFITRACGSYLGAHSHHCGADAFFVFVNGETAVGFRCWQHREDA